jgi:hypothetical protein
MTNEQSIGSRPANVYTYPRNEPGTLGHLDLIEPLRALPEELARELRGISEREALYREAPESWCLKEQLGHLRDYAEVTHKRLYMVSTQTDPRLEPYDQDAYAREHRYTEREVDQMLIELRDHRAATVELLTSLVNWNWARTGVHTELGRMSIRQMVERMIRHEAGHLADVRRLRALARERA